MFCNHCGYYVHIKKDDGLVCPHCHEPLNLGSKYTLISHERRDGMARSYVHDVLHNGTTCYIDMSNMMQGLSERALFHVESDDADNFIRGVTTSPVENVSDVGITVTLTTRNTVYVFQKSERG